MVAPRRPSRVDPLAARLSEGLGGPLGDRAGRHPWWTPLRVVLVLTGVALAGGMLSKGACVGSGWGDGERAFAELCWTEVAGLGATGQATPGWSSYVDLPPALLAALLAPLALLGAWLVSTSRPGPASWAGAGWALSPVLLTQWLSWEVVSAVALAGVLWSVARRRWVLAATGALGAGAASPWATTDPLAVDVGSWWLVAEQRRDALVPADWLGWVLVGCAVILAAALVALHRVRPLGAPVALTLALAGLLLVAPSAPPEAALLLLPGAALAVARWSDLVAWQVCEVVSWMITGWYLGGVLAPSAGGDATTYWAAVLIRTLGLLWLAVGVLRPGPDAESSRAGTASGAGAAQATTTRSKAVAV